MGVQSLQHLASHKSVVLQPRLNNGLLFAQGQPFHPAAAYGTNNVLPRAQGPGRAGGAKCHRKHFSLKAYQVEQSSLKLRMDHTACAASGPVARAAAVWHSGCSRLLDAATHSSELNRDNDSMQSKLRGILKAPHLLQAPVSRKPPRHALIIESCCCWRHNLLPLLVCVTQALEQSPTGCLTLECVHS